jgi:hypothetical protein
MVDLRSRIATIVYQGPQLSPALTAHATPSFGQTPGRARS